MEYLGEAIALSIDGIILGVCLRQYFVCSKAINAVKVNNYLIKKKLYVFILYLTNDSLNIY